ncbi:MAG: WYL domain-containing protein [Thermoleophilia bacterium]
MAAIKKKGAPRDQQKLVRQLSLVAYLMAKKGRPVSADDVLRNVEGYDFETMSPATFARRFYADRSDLARLGIEIESSQDEFSEAVSYWLPPENCFLPAVPFSSEELAALHTCLYLLEGQFAYSHLLRQALQSLALGSGNVLDDPATSGISVDMASSGYDAEVAKRQQKIDDAVASRKTIRFEYHTFSSDQVEERQVDPYSMMYTHGEWYLVGYSHERDGIRMFKLRRILGRIKYIDKKDHNFDAPTDFAMERYINLEPWQLGPELGAAEISFSAQCGWWARNNYSRCGDFEMHDDGSCTFRTGYADGQQICSLVLGRSADSRLDGPEELRLQIADILEKIAGLHEAAPTATAPVLEPQPERYADEAVSSGRQPQVEPERFTQLARTVTYLESRLNGEEFISLPVEEVCHDLGLDRQELAQLLAILFVVSAGGGGDYLVNGTIVGDSLQVEGFPYGELLKKPLRLTPREARAMLLAIDLVGGQILAGRNQSLENAREKIIHAAGGLDDLDTIPIGEAGREDYDICRAINRGLAEQRLVEIEYLSRSSGEIISRVIEPYLVNGTKGQWYLVAWCRKRDEIRTFRFEMIRSARLLDETFELRDIDLDSYRADPRLPSGKQAPQRAQVLFSPAIARWVYEKQPDTAMLDDGSLLGEIPWFDKEWIIDEVLRYCGEAVVVAPAELRQQVRQAALRLASEYR